MPAKSQAQRRFMCAAAAGKTGATIKREDAEEFCHTKGKLPEKLSDFREKKKSQWGSLKK